jgi:hypothetical protein
VRLKDQVGLITATVFISLFCLGGAAVVHQKARLLATGTPVDATVAKLWTEQAKSKGGGLVYFARLVFDRRQGNSSVVHCDVPRVLIGVHPTTLGPTIKVVPQAASCWEPYVICETCPQPSDNLALGLLTVAAVSGLIFFVQARIILREKSKPA